MRPLPHGVASASRWERAGLAVRCSLPRGRLPFPGRSGARPARGPTQRRGGKSLGRSGVSRGDGGGGLGPHLCPYTRPWPQFPPLRRKSEGLGDETPACRAGACESRSRQGTPASPRGPALHPMLGRREDMMLSENLVTKATQDRIPCWKCPEQANPWRQKAHL